MLAITAIVAVLSLSGLDDARLVKGEVIVAVERDPDSSVGKVDAWMDIPAPPGLVWETLSDCAGAPSFIPQLISCQIIERGPNGAWEIREHIADPGWLVSNMRSRFRADLVEAQELRFTQIEGDFEIMEGRWTLSPLGPSGTRLRYQAHLKPRIWVPAFAIRQAIEIDAPDTLRALRAEVLRRKAPD